MNSEELKELRGLITTRNSKISTVNKETYYYNKREKREERRNLIVMCTTIRIVKRFPEIWTGKEVR